MKIRSPLLVELHAFLAVYQVRLVREMHIEAVERRNGSLDAVPVAHTLEFLSGTGGAYIAAEARALARALGLKPINTPVCSPQSNRMADRLRQLPSSVTTWPA